MVTSGERTGAETDAIHGWGCTPTSDLPSAAITSQEHDAAPKYMSILFHTGWRRTSLYCIIIFLMLIVFINIALTLWILTVLKLNGSGIGPIKIVKGGIQLEGNAWIADSLVASTISSQTAQPVTLRSYRNFTVLVSEPDSVEHAKLVLKRDRMQCSGREFEVKDSRGGNVFYASRSEVKVFTESLLVDGVGGLLVQNAIQTPYLRAPPGADLRLESATRRLDIRAPQSIYLESRAGGIDIKSLNNINFDSIVGAIKIDSPNIIINNLKEANVTDKPQSGLKNKKVYQLCACTSGKLFLAAADALCEARDDDTDLCR